MAHRSAGIAADEHHHRRADRLPRRQLLLPRRRRRADRSVNGRMVLSQRRHRSARFDLPQPCPLRPLSARGLCPRPPQRTGLRRDRRTPDDGRVGHRPARHGPARSPPGHAAGRGGRSLGRARHVSRPVRFRSRTARALSERDDDHRLGGGAGRRPHPQRPTRGARPAGRVRRTPRRPTCRRVCRQRPPSPRWPPATVSSSAAWG